MMAAKAAIWTNAVDAAYSSAVMSRRTTQS